MDLKSFEQAFVFFQTFQNVIQNKDIQVGLVDLVSFTVIYNL